MRATVLGSGGQLGAAVVHELRPHHEVSAFDHAALDVTDDDAVGKALERTAPDVIVNCTGFNAVDAAEDRPVEAMRTNAFAVRALARSAASRGAILVHYGTDFVFDGNATEPYTEQDRPNPQSVYAASKLIGEWLAAGARRAYVLRVESLFGRAPEGRAKGSVQAIVDGLLAGTTPRVFQDRVVSPTYVLDAARATRLLIEQRAPAGLYHCVNSGWCTWLDLAYEAARLLGVDARIEPVRLADVVLRAARPRYCALSNRKLLDAGVEMPTWQAALTDYLATFV